MHEDIGGLEITMHDVIGSKDTKRIDKLLEIGEDLCFWKAALPTDLLVECPSITELIEEIEVVDCLQDFDETDDVRAIDAG